ncbi:MAG: tRNA (N(6)-L-threonylcarbamoyladenosine(37)-C(2))-methylthiotransferase MtaB [Oscillospiraceae bacterium]|nr:tRNA (N(6)-L-threonylcarbamoyladenosine(37)-C(2))-methylthiotransferase MtaB [Oscillospiraceae bacterium]
MNVFFITFGCKVNCYETECIKEEFLKKGFMVSKTHEEADVIVINSCTVTSSGDKKLRQTIRKMRHESPHSIIVLTGCYPQAFREKAASLTEADIITGTKDRRQITTLVDEFIKDRMKKISVKEYTVNDPIEDITCSSFESKTRAFVKIQDGCNQFCSYCIIPYSRGRIRSKSLETLTGEVKKFAESGHQEIVLVGINLAFYGAEYGISLTDAVEACSEIDGVTRIRLGSLEPEKILDRDLERLSENKKFCPQFHLSLQSGCDKTLRNMNRKYTGAEYEQLVEKIREKFDSPSITTDIMVGFPGETDEDFEESLNFVKKIGFSKIHVFPYSVREGTKAASMPDQIDGGTKTKRAMIMSKLGEELEADFLKKQVGKTFPILFEKENCTDFHQGYSPNYTLVKIKRSDPIKSLRNMIFYVNIKEAVNDFCVGEIQITE